MGSLFAGIGGFDLGFERAGFKTSWQVEIDPYCQKVLAKNFPEVERFGDIRECGSYNLKPVDVICGGFPCQDISNAGLRAGITGERSGLWGEMVRTIRLVRPKFALVENVAALLGRGMGTVLGDLSEIGHDAEWDCISASDVGAPHLRERIWILANPSRIQQGWQEQRPQWERVGQGGESIASRTNPETAERWRTGNPQYTGRWNSEIRGLGEWARGIQHWLIEPNVGRVANGIPKRVDRLRGLGNAVVPQIPEMIARRIKQALEVA
jgi:DNA (cytosine-5)-methyltransferase 1